MAVLNDNWITEGLIDFEYKKYILLAYLKHVKSNFDDRKLYPFLSDLIFHYKELQKIRGEKQKIKRKFPKKIVDADLSKMSFVYKAILQDDELMKEIDGIVEYALKNIRFSVDEGKEIFEFVEENLSIEPIGICPISNMFGYILITMPDRRSEVHIYKYSLSRLRDTSDNYWSIMTEFVETQKKRVFETFEQIKISLIKKNKEMPNPATYLVSSNFAFPMEETLLPISKRLLIRQLSAA